MKRYFDKEEIERANGYNLVDLLSCSGYSLVKQGREYYLKEHDSFKISEYKGWIWYSRGKSGKNIDFFMIYENLSFVAAVNRIFEVAGDYSIEKKEVMPADKSAGSEAKEESPEKRSLCIPEKNEDSKRVYAYLTKTRGLDPKLVKALLKSGHLYESKGTHNVVFLGTDYRGNIVSSYERGTMSEKRFTRDTEGSDKRYRFRITDPAAEKVNVFEAEIDLLSHITINGIRDENYIALGGTSDTALMAFLDARPDVHEVNICLDNDAAGEKAYLKIADSLKNEGYIVTRQRPVYKDFNEDLIAFLKKAELEKEAEV